MLALYESERCKYAVIRDYMEGCNCGLITQAEWEDWGECCDGYGVSQCTYYEPIEHIDDHIDCCNALDDVIADLYGEDDDIGYDGEGTQSLEKRICQSEYYGGDK